MFSTRGCVRTLVMLCSLLPLPVPAVKFTKKPSDVVYSKSGADVYFEWDYEVDRSDLKTTAFQWFTFDPPFDLVNQRQIYVETKAGIKQLGAQVPASLQGRVDFQGKATLIIRNVSKADDNYYQFVVGSISDGNVENTVKLFVTDPPTVIKPIVPCHYINGNQVNVTCNTTGVPTPSVHWIRMIDDYKYQTFTGVSYLTFDPVDKGDAGQYKCIASNSVGSDEETVDIVVYYEPYIIVGETNSTVGSWNGNNLTLQCVAKGEPQAKFQWYKPGGQQITSNVFSIEDSSTVAIQTGPGDYGEYKCRASNAAGVNEHLISVNQWVKPGEPKITDPEIGGSYIILKWTPPSNNGGSQVIDYKVTVFMSDGDQQRTLPPVTGTHTLIDGLKPGWSYLFFLSARNVVGYSNFVSGIFTTKSSCKPATSIILNNETEISSKQITLIWSASPEYDAKILTYTVWWRQIDSAGGVGKWSSRNTCSDALSFTVTWLEFGITYDFGVTARNIYGEGALDDEYGLKRIKVVQNSTAGLSSMATSHDKACRTNVVVIGGLFGVMVVFNLIQLSYIIWLRRNMKVEEDKRSSKSFYEEKCTHKMYVNMKDYNSKLYANLEEIHGEKEN